MVNVNGSPFRSLCGVAACTSALAVCADGATVHRSVDWPVPAGGLMVQFDQSGRQDQEGTPRDLVVSPSREVGARGGSAGDGRGQSSLNGWNVSGTRFVSIAANLRFGAGRIDVGSTAASRVIAEIAWQDVPHTGVQVGHAPAAGPLVLLGIATLVGGPRRERPVRPSTGRSAA